MEKSLQSRLLQDAQSAYQNRRYPQAAGLYEEAAQAYRAAGDLLLAAEMENNRSVALLQAGDAAGALQAAQGTDAVFAQAGSTVNQALALGNQAAALEALGRNKEALEHYRQCSELLKPTNASDQRSYVLGRISALELRNGNALEAMAAMEVALNNRKKLSLRERVLQKILGIPFQMIRRK